jgi:S-adenosylmethionine decarboxylase
MHLAIDGFDGEAKKLWDKELITQFLIEYPDALKMHRITEPKVVNYEDPKGTDSGISGFVIIAESHISVHTFPDRNYVNIDIFSCKAFDNEKALNDAKKLLGLKKVKTWVLDRGLEWLSSAEGQRHMDAQRTELSPD